MMKKLKLISTLMLSIVAIAGLVNCTGSTGTNGAAADNKNLAINVTVKDQQIDAASAIKESADTTYKVTFIELGSVRCIPCQQMQPVMKSVKEKYGKQVKVIFYDVWTKEGEPYADKYGVNAIPTQVFLDETGKEYYRHVGFFQEEELVKILIQKGVKQN